MNCEDIIRVKYLNFHEYKMKERVTRVESGGGGGGEEEEKMEKYPHYSIDMKSTLPIEVIRGWWIFWVL